MQPPTSPAFTTEFKDILQRLSRPIEFAARDNYAHVHGVKSLGPFVCEQVLQALAKGPHAVAVEINLLALRQLFQDFDQTSAFSERGCCCGSWRQDGSRSLKEERRRV